VIIKRIQPIKIEKPLSMIQVWRFRFWTICKTLVVLKLKLRQWC